MPLDPQAKLVLDNLPDDLLDIENTTPLELRKMYEGHTELPFPKEEVASIEDRVIPGPDGDVPVRIYRPASDEPRPAVAFFHGGGWVIGNLETHDGIARKLCNASGSVLVSVDYRLAPESRFPAAAEDCLAATSWTAANAAELGARPGPIAVAGDSAGGNLAAVVSLMARDRRGPEIGFQLLVYPVVDCDFERPSYRENAEGYMLTRDVMRWFWDQYVPEPGERRHPYVNPLAAENLADLPPALVLTAEFDPLRDEGEAYAAALAAAGVPVTCTRYDGMIHGFFSFADFVDAAKRAVAESAGAVRAAIG